MRFRSSVVALTGAALLFVSGATLAAGADGKLRYQAQVLRTSYGIPHIQATDWGSLGYGYGYAFAQDNFCVLARDILVSTGTQSRYFGPGTGSGNLISDWVFAMVNADSRVDPAYASLGQDTRDLLQGYADGYNLYLSEKGPLAGAAECRGSDWVRPIDGRDVYKVLRKLLVRAGTGNFAAALVGAVPPSLRVAASVGGTDREGAAPTAGEALRLALADREAKAATDEARREASEQPDFRPERFGSNALALGGDLTGGAGALLGNPHFPWFGIERFYAVHLTIPGRYDVMGASIYGFPLVNIGFNRNVAWSHTVSTARRFVIRELRLDPTDDTAYLYDGRSVPMQPETVTVDVLVAPGTVVPVPHTFWQTQFGPALIIPPLAVWSPAFAYALTDVNLDNTRAFELYRDLGASRSVHEIRQALGRYVALPWVNTIAADSSGNAFYGDITVVPHVTAAKLAACANTVVARTLSFGARVYTIDGSNSACDPGSDADAPVPGIFGPGNLPSIVRRDYAHNANDSYWLANPEARLEGYSPLIGADENRPQGFRTRLGLTQVRDRLAGTDGLPGTGFGRQWLQDVLFGNRHYSAEIMLDGVLELCAEEDNDVDLGGITVNVADGCVVLAAWDRRNKITSVGPQLWTEFWSRARSAPGLHEVPFDAADPVVTPRGVNLADAALRLRLMRDLAGAVQYLGDLGIAIDAPWGTVQFDVRNGEVIPIHGGSGTSGVYNAIAPGGPVPGVGYTPIFAGSSYIQAVTFTPSGPDARAIVSYSQSTDPESPHFADMTRLFSQSGWVKMPFKEGDIRRDPNLSVIRLNAVR